MDIVVDASAIIAVIMNEPSRAAIIEATIAANLMAPESIHWEIGNAISAMFKRKLISIEQAVQAVRIYETIPIRLVRVELEASLVIAKKADIYAYDAYLIQCALKYKAPLLTLDNKLTSLAEKMGVELVKVK